MDTNARAAKTSTSTNLPIVTLELWLKLRIDSPLSLIPMRFRLNNRFRPPVLRSSRLLRTPRKRSLSRRPLLVRSKDVTSSNLLMVAVPRPKEVEEVAIAAAKVAVVVATVMAVTVKVAVVSAAEETVVIDAEETVVIAAEETVVVVDSAVVIVKEAVVIVKEAVVVVVARVVVDALELPVRMEKLPLKAVLAVMPPAEDVADREIEISPREIDSTVRHVRMPTQWTDKTELDVDVVATARQAVAEEPGATRWLLHLVLKKSLRRLPPPPSRRRSRLLQSKRKRKLDIPLMTSLPRRLRNPPDS